MNCLSVGARMLGAERSGIVLKKYLLIPFGIQRMQIWLRKL